MSCKEPIYVTFRQMDLSIPCPVCGRTQQCRDLKKGISHIGRRVKWLLATVHKRARKQLIILP